MKNMINRKILHDAGSYKDLETYQGIRSKNISYDNNKLLSSIDEALEEVELEDGMTISFHHHFREGDILLNLIIKKLAEKGLKNLTLAPSSLARTHSEIIPYIKEGVISQIQTSGLRDELAEEISKGIMDKPVIIRSHGGRAGAISTGRLEIDIAFIAAPSADSRGNIYGATGKSACGSLGYGRVDAEYARQVIAFTDNLEEFPLENVSIPQKVVDYVVEVDKVGNPEQIASGALRKTSINPKNDYIANMVTEVISSSPYFKDNFSLQTGSGSISLATTQQLQNKMKENKIQGSFLLGGITTGHVELLEKELFKIAYDTQTFDIEAVKSLNRNSNHVEIDCEDYADPFNKGPLVNDLNFVVLSALEIDTNYNVNVITGSDGIIRGASGGHSDTAAGADLTIVVAPSIRGRIPTIKDEVTTIITPGETVDILVTDRGVCVNPKRKELIEYLSRNSNLNLKDIETLQKEVEKLTGKPKPIEFDDEVVALVEYRDGTIIDTIKKVKE